MGSPLIYGLGHDKILQCIIRQFLHINHRHDQKSPYLQSIQRNENQLLILIIRSFQKIVPSPLRKLEIHHLQLQEYPLAILIHRFRWCRDRLSENYLALMG